LDGFVIENQSVVFSLICSKRWRSDMFRNLYAAKGADCKQWSTMIL
jgi:hypothetical protein